MAETKKNFTEEDKSEKRVRKADLQMLFRSLIKTKREIITIVEEETEWGELNFKNICFKNENHMVDLAITTNVNAVANSEVWRVIKRINELSVLPEIDDYIIKCPFTDVFEIIFIFADEEIEDAPI